MISLADTAIHTPAQARIQALLDDLTRSGLETGVQVAAYLDGELVVDAWSGIANPATGEPVGCDTRFMTFSASKGVTTTLIHQLAAAGKLAYDAPIAQYWPEFAAQGKGAITVRHVLCHQAGIPQAPRGITLAMLGDWAAMVRAIEELRPLWTPGTKTGYHGLTFGVILGELAQRVAGRPFAQLVQEQICQPLGIDDLMFGIAQELEEQVAIIHGKRVPWSFFPPFVLLKRVIPTAIEPGLLWNGSAIRRGVIPAGNMITSARSLARHYAALCGDGVDGVRLLPRDHVRSASALQTDAPDQVFFGGRIRKALGYWVGGSADSSFGMRTSVFGHTGAGGSIAFADPDYRFSLALLKNQMSWRGPEDTDQKVIHAIRAALCIPA